MQVGRWAVITVETEGIRELLRITLMGLIKIRRPVPLAPGSFSLAAGGTFVGRLLISRARAHADDPRRKMSPKQRRIF